MKSIAKGFMGTGFLVLLAGCSGGDGGGGGSSSGVAGKARIGQIGSTSVNLMAAPKWGDVKASTGKYSWAKMEGMKIQLLSIAGNSSTGSNNFKTFETPKTLELGGDTAVIKFEEDIAVPEGTYSDAGIRFKNDVQLKAFCRTANGCYYTTASGVKKVATASCGDAVDLPNDYGYYAVGKMLPDPHYGNEIMEYNKLTYSIAAGQTPYLNLLVDTSYTVTCADETAFIDDANEAGKMPPFNWSMSTGNFSDYYKGQTGNFAFSYVPLFTYLSTTADEALPIGETYATSAQSADVPDASETFDMVNSLITTIAFDANGEVIAARSRNLTHKDGTTLNQGWSGFKKTGSAYEMMSGEHYAGSIGDYSDARWLQDRKITGFERSADFTSRQTINVTNGPDCGKNLNGHNLSCLSSDIPSYWKRIKR